MTGIQNVSQVVVKAKSNGKEFQCPQCSESFRFRRHYDKHLEGHKHNNCKHCDKLFTVRKKLVAHLLEEHGIKLQDFKYNCQACDKVFAKRISLYQHLQVHATGKNVCLQCGRIFSDNSEFLKHQNKHKLTKSWKCDECDEIFSRHQQYMTHIQDHGKYKCLTCSKNFSAHTKLAEHKRKGHMISELEPKYACLICDRSFHRSRALVLHRRVHQGKSSEDKGSCSNNVIYKGSHSKCLYDNGEIGYKEKIKCRKKIENVQNSAVSFLDDKNESEILKNQDLDEKGSEKCMYCDYQSSSKANLKRHLEFHTEERKFICECCGASFYMLSTLKEHFLYVHSEKRNFPCPQCDKSFKRKSGLNRHLRDHSESRPFACYCGQFYKRKSHLLRHQEASHGLVSHPRKLCKLRRNDSGILVPIEEKKTSPKSKKKSARSPKNKKIEISDDPTFSCLHDREKDQRSNWKECEGSSLNHSSLKNCTIPNNYGGNKEDMEEVSFDIAKSCYKDTEVVGVSDRVISSTVHNAKEGLKELDKSEPIEMDKCELMKATFSQKSFINLEMDYVLESISSNHGNSSQNTGAVVENQVLSYPSPCVIDVLQDIQNQMSIVDLIQIVPHDVLLSGENTVFLCLSSGTNHDTFENAHDVPG